MGKRQAYADRLVAAVDWDAFLKGESGLPGPRGNLELAAAFVDVASRDKIIGYAQLDAEQAPENTPQGYLAFCGVFGLGRLIAEGESDHLSLLRRRAHDPRWRVREAVAMALQRLGDADIGALIAAVDDWRRDPLERRAAIAGLCEPRLLERMTSLDPVFGHLDDATRWLEGQSGPLDEEGKVLRKGLAYAWSVAVCGQPDEGKAAMEAWLGNSSPNVRWVMKQNLGKARLIRLDPDWVEGWEAAWRQEKPSLGG
jgi:hypothetical protein